MSITRINLALVLAAGEPGENQPSEPSRHPEANLRRLRHAFASEEYTDDLQPYLERSLGQAPSCLPDRKQYPIS